MCSPSLLYVPVNLDMPNANTCLQPILQQVRPISTHSRSPCCGKPSETLSLQQSRCKIYDGTRQTEYQIHVREGRVDKSLHQNFYRKPSHVCAIMPCTEGLFKARKFPSGCWHCTHGYRHYSIATQPADYNYYLISKLCVYLFFFKSLMLLSL